LLRPVKLAIDAADISNWFDKYLGPVH